MAFISFNNKKLNEREFKGFEIFEAVSTGKIIPYVSLPKGVTCRSDAPCLKLCYAGKGRQRFQTVVDTHWRNYEEYTKFPRAYFDSIATVAKYAPFFRYHVAGDIPDLNYIDYMFETAELSPKCQFLAFTKRYEWVDQKIEEYGEIPPNMHFVYSAWGEFVPLNPFKIPVCYVSLKSGEGQNLIPTDAYQCMCNHSHDVGCTHCNQTDHSCWKLNRGESVVINEH